MRNRGFLRGSRLYPQNKADLPLWWEEAESAGRLEEGKAGEGERLVRRSKACLGCQPDFEVSGWAEAEWAGGERSGREPGERSQPRKPLHSALAPTGRWMYSANRNQASSWSSPLLQEGA